MTNPNDRGFDGPGLAVNVAALSLSGAGDIIYDIQVVNGRTPTPDVVWQQRVTSSQTGDSNGSATWIGPCDADPAVATNTVKLWVVGVYNADVTVAQAGNFASGVAPGTIGSELPFQNPTAAGPLTLVTTCQENEDVAVTFNVTLMRPANQGFFDIAVNFQDIFCSAKYDCCTDLDNNGSCTQANEPLKLLFDSTGARQKTQVLAIACTGGTEANNVTDLYLDDLVLTCGPQGGGFRGLTVNPAASVSGNQCVPGSNGVTACTPTVTETGVDADSLLYQVAVYRGKELLTNNGGTSANKVYWNVALGVQGSYGTCQLSTHATADNLSNTSDGANGGAIAAGQVYPVIDFDVNMGTCGAAPLTFGNPTAPVRTSYTATTGTARTFGHTYHP